MRGRTRDGDETINLVEDGVYDAFSIFYDVKQRKFVSEGGQPTRVLEEIELYHVGILDCPMNEGALVSGFKQLQQKELQAKGLWSLAELLKHLDYVQDFFRYGSAENISEAEIEFLGMLLGRLGPQESEDDEEAEILALPLSFLFKAATRVAAKLRADPQQDAIDRVEMLLPTLEKTSQVLRGIVDGKTGGKESENSTNDETQNLTALNRILDNAATIFA